MRMSPQLSKEVRCILPTWLAAVVTVTIAAAASRFGGPRFLLNPLCAVMTILLGASSFGSEFQYKTMPLLVSQPLDRARLWTSKMIVLGPALARFSAVAAALAPYPPGNYLVKLMTHLAAAAIVFGIVPWLTLVYRDGLTGARNGARRGWRQRDDRQGHIRSLPRLFPLVERGRFGAAWRCGLPFGIREIPGLGIGPCPTCPIDLASTHSCSFTPGSRAAGLRPTALRALARKELRLQAMSFAYVGVFCTGFGLVALLVHMVPDRLALLKNFVRVYCVTFPVLVGSLSVALNGTSACLSGSYRFRFPQSANGP